MEAINNFLKENQNTLQNVSNLGISIVITGVIVFLLLKLEKTLAKKWISKHDNINSRFTEKVIRSLIIFIGFMWVIMGSPLTQSFGNSLFQGTAVLAAIAGFAAKPILSDMFCGFMISSTRPFNIGDRIELSDGTAGIVKDITVRHVVLQGIDTLRIVIPNSEINSMRVTNLSREPKSRSIHFRFSVGLNTDVEQAKKVIREAIAASPHTRPREGDQYSPVYFIAYQTNGLEMATTVYYEPTSPTEVVKDDVNSRVKQALDASHIEIPYNYINVLTPEAGQDA